MNRRAAEAFWTVLSAVDPGLRAETSVARLREDGRLLEDAVGLATANGLSFPFLRRLREWDVRLPARAEDRWRQDSESAIRVRDTLERLNDASRATGISYTVIKNCMTVDHVPRDLDVFIPSGEREGFLAALGSQGLRLAYHDEAEISLQGPGLLKVDVYSRIHYLGRDFLRPEYLLGSRTTASAHGATHPTLLSEAAFLLNSAHGLFGHGAMSLLDFMDLTRLRQRISDPAAVRAEAASLGWGRVLDRWLGRLQEMERRVYGDRVPMRFPVRHGTRFVLGSVAALDGAHLGPRDFMALRASLWWDDLVFLSEVAGLD